MKITKFNLSKRRNKKIKSIEFYNEYQLYSYNNMMGGFLSEYKFDYVFIGVNQIGKK